MYPFVAFWVFALEYFQRGKGLRGWEWLNLVVYVCGVGVRDWYACVHVWMGKCMYECMYVYVHVCMCACVHVQVRKEHFYKVCMCSCACATPSANIGPVCVRACVWVCGCACA